MSLVTLQDFFPDCAAVAALEVRTPKRPTGYAAQVWAARGYWEVGVLPTSAAARVAAEKFLATAPVEPDPQTPRSKLPANWHRRRSNSHAPRYKWVRKVKGFDTWQARIPLGPMPGGSLNLGLFSSADHGENAEWAAAQVSRAFVREWKPGRTVGEVVEALKNSPKRNERVPEHVVVPEKYRDRKPPTIFGPVKNAKELRVEQTSKWVTLADFFAAA